METNSILKKESILDIAQIRDDFPILRREINGRRLVYLDNAATTQKPRAVLTALESYYRHFNANVHRGLHTLAEEATASFEKAREKTANFIGARTTEMIYTRNTTEAINLVAYTWGEKNIESGDNIVLTEMEHHANLVPWIVLAKKKHAELRYIKIDSDGNLDLSDIDKLLDHRTKLVAVTQMSNVLGTINPVELIIEKAHKNGSVVLIDGAQSVPHMPVKVNELDADFLAFSAHKMLGPTGIGFLYGKENILESMEPFLFGGEMISEVSYTQANWNQLPWKFEAGTPNIADAIAFSPAIDYLLNLGMSNIREHENYLTEYALDKFAELEYVTIYGPKDAEARGGAISFNVAGVHPHDMATYLDAEGIAVRAGHHCAQPLMRKLGLIATVRASFYIYTTVEEIDILIESVKRAKRYFGHDR